MQQYTFKVIQGIDAGRKLGMSVDVECPAGITEDVLTRQIGEAFEMPGSRSSGIRSRRALSCRA